MVQCLYCDTTCNDHNDTCPNYVPPMPKVKDPMTESLKTYRGVLLDDMDKADLIEAVECLGELYQDAISIKPRELTPSPLPRKEVISVQPGDVIVLTNPYDIPTEQRELAETDLKRMFPGNESLFLSNGVTLEVYREQEAEEKVYCAVCTKSPCRCVGEQEKPEGKWRQGEKGTLRCNTCGSTVKDTGQMESNPPPRYLSIREIQGASPYITDKNTCADCDQGRCDRTLHNPCDDEVKP